MAILSDKTLLTLKYLPFMLSFLARSLTSTLQHTLHRLTYKPVAHPKNVVIIGASFAGFFTAKNLIHSLPTGYRVILIEKNEHLHYVFNFPRYSVLQGRERMAFIPYDGLKGGAVAGILEMRRAEVRALERGKVVLDGGEEVEFAFCVIATGGAQPFPARLKASGTEEACGELRGAQKNVEAAARVAVVGAGPVGLEMATDIKGYYPEKDVTLVSSREHLLPAFGPKLREYSLEAVVKLGVKVLLNARPSVDTSGVDGGKHALLFADGRREEYDLIITCTGQTANSGLLESISKASVPTQHGSIKVEPTLQVADPGLAHIFALGDVAETGGPRMGRAAWYQARVVADNIVALVKGKSTSALKRYTPDIGMEGSIKLTLGKHDYATYSQDENKVELLVPGSDNSEDLDIIRAWGMYDVKCDVGSLTQTTIVEKPLV